MHHQNGTGTREAQRNLGLAAVPHLQRLQTLHLPLATAAPDMLLRARRCRLPGARRISRSIGMLEQTARTVDILRDESPVSRTASMSVCNT